jgi:CrcB protein
VVNVVGCFLFGAIWSLSNERLALSGEAKILILTGFMGAFTTFSTLIADSSILMADSQWIQGLGNILMHSVVGIVAFFVGLAIIRVV